MIVKRHYACILSLLLAVPFLAAGPAVAQDQGGGAPGGWQGGRGRRGPMSPDDRLKQMTKDFNLTSDQQGKIKPILETEQKKMQDLRNDTTVDRQSMRAKMQQIHQDSNTQIRSTLDDKQKAMFDKQEQDREQHMQNRRGGPGGPGDQGGPPPQN